MDTNSFKEKLDTTHQWPEHYRYKFIVPNNEKKRTEVESLFEKGAKFEWKVSGKGTYASLTVNQYELSSDRIITIYQHATKIDGLIAL